jgi:hypothetical protein
MYFSPSTREGSPHKSPTTDLRSSGQEGLREILEQGEDASNLATQLGATKSRIHAGHR